VEMNSTPDRVIATLTSIPGYVQLFESAFPDEAQPVTLENVARAIEAFEATLLTPGSRFDRFLQGDATAMDTGELEGFQLFQDRGCVACHGGMTLGGTAYFPFGVVERPGGDIVPPGDMGRYQVTRTDGDEYVFKAPSLRNIALTEPYFHSGKVWNLERAVAIMSSAQLGIELSNEETHAIVAYLQTLNGEMPEVEYPVLPPHTDETPRPYTGPEPLGKVEH
jgi:cytochrome c peroxidase